MGQACRLQRVRVRRRGGGVRLGALRSRWWAGRVWPLACAQVAVDAGALTRDWGAGAVCRVHVAARVALVHLWVLHPSVFDFGAAPCTGFVGSSKCVLALLVLPVVCRCALVFVQQLCRLFLSCAVFMLAQPHGACTVSYTHLTLPTILRV